MSVSIINRSVKSEDVATNQMVDVASRHPWFHEAMGKGDILVPVMNRSAEEMTEYVVQTIERAFPENNICSTPDLTYRNRVRLYHAIKYVSEQTHVGWNLDNSYGRTLHSLIRSRREQRRTA
jgi:hypothetical protein